MRKPRTAPPSDAVLRKLIPAAARYDDVAAALGLTSSTVARHAKRLGIRSQHIAHEGMPDDERLFSDLYLCDSFRELAEEYGVPEYAVRNEAKRLGVTAPSKRGVYGRTREVMAPWAQPAA